MKRSWRLMGMAALRNPGLLTVIAIGLAIGGCTSEVAAPSTSLAPEPLIVTSTSTTMPPSKVSGPDADGAYTAVLATANAYESCWEQREPDEYLLAIQWLGFALTPPELSHVIDGVAQPTVDGPATTAFTRPRTGETDPGEHLPTVKDAFVRIADVVAREPDSVAVAFDEELCHPTRIGVNPDLDAVDDEGTTVYTVIPAGRDDVSIAPIESIGSRSGRYEVELGDGTTFSADRSDQWTPCVEAPVQQCGALIVKDDAGSVVYSVAAVPDRSTGWWSLPTFGAIEVETDHLVLWEGVRIELHPDFHSIPSTQGTECQSLVAGETVWAEVFIDPSTSQAMAFSCW